MIASAQDVLDLGLYAATTDDSIKTMQMAKLLASHTPRSVEECLELPYIQFLKEALDVMNQLQIEVGTAYHIEIPKAFVEAFRCQRTCCN